MLCKYIVHNGVVFCQSATPRKTEQPAGQGTSVTGDEQSAGNSPSDRLVSVLFCVHS